MRECGSGDHLTARVFSLVWCDVGMSVHRGLANTMFGLDMYLLRSTSFTSRKVAHILETNRG